MLDMKELLAFSVEAKASDVHIAVGIPPKLRINGKLTEVEVPALSPADAAEAIGSTMKDRHKAILQDRGEVDFSFDSPETGRFRVNVFMDKGNMAAAYRRVETQIPRPDQLGIPREVVELYKRKRGLVLVTGPTGSGKSTTLASIINKANENLTDHIITLEDPIEYIHHHNKAIVNQREVGMDTLSYANALRAALREDPDIILVGEMRDLETISTAITAAETGHLVFSTLHTNSSSDAIDRMIDVFPPHQQQQIRVQLSGVLEGIVAQHLLPMVNGGRIAAFEVLLANNAIRNLIREAKAFQIPSIIQTSKREGMMMMDDCILQYYSQGLIAPETAVAYAHDPVSMASRVHLYY